jgi:uncharacterized membrane protein
MTQLRKRTLWIVAIWSVVGTGFLATFFAAGGAESFAEDSGRIAAGSVFLAFGVIGTPVMLTLTRARAGAEHLVADERDDRLARRANPIGMTIVAMYVFLVCIVLWDAYREPGAVPVGWMWFLAYTTMILTYLSTAIVQLVMDLGDFGSAIDGEG